MQFKKYVGKVIDNIKEYNKPENVKERLEKNIEISKLKLEYEELERKRKQEKFKSFSIGEIKIGEK